VKNRCGYLNRDNSCNYTNVCDEQDCVAILSNYMNVQMKAIKQIKSGISLLEDMFNERRSYERNLERTDGTVV